MDITALSTPTQVILASAMIAILIAWLIVFALLAVRSNPGPDLDKQEISEDQPTPARSFPAVTIQVSQQNVSR
jgi:flagellar biosynthesis/type III secretory pathway M-ring protein FliF/YscJ